MGSRDPLILEFNDNFQFTLKSSPPSSDTIQTLNGQQERVVKAFLETPAAHIDHLTSISSNGQSDEALAAGPVRLPALYFVVFRRPPPVLPKLLFSYLPLPSPLSSFADACGTVSLNIRKTSEGI